MAWAWIAAVLLAVVLGAAGFWIGRGLGAGIGVAAGGLVPLLIERAARRQETVVSARRASISSALKAGITALLSS